MLELWMICILHVSAGERRAETERVGSEQGALKERVLDHANDPIMANALRTHTTKHQLNFCLNVVLSICSQFPPPLHTLPLSPPALINMRTPPPGVER